jgi:hypothetical protein
MTANNRDVFFDTLAEFEANKDALPVGSRAHIRDGYYTREGVLVERPDYSKYDGNNNICPGNNIAFTAPGTGFIIGYGSTSDTASPGTGTYTSVYIYVNNVQIYRLNPLGVTYLHSRITFPISKGDIIRINVTASGWTPTHFNAFAFFVPSLFVEVPRPVIVAQSGSDLSLDEKPVMIIDDNGIRRQKLALNGQPLFTQSFNIIIPSNFGAPSLIYNPIIIPSGITSCMLKEVWSVNDSGDKSTGPIWFNSDSTISLYCSLYNPVSIDGSLRFRVSSPATALAVAWANTTLTVVCEFTKS